MLDPHTARMVAATRRATQSLAVRDIPAWDGSPRLAAWLGTQQRPALPWRRRDLAKRQTAFVDALLTRGNAMPVVASEAAVVKPAGRGASPKPMPTACAAAKPSEVGFTRWQVRAAERLVLAEVSKTLAREHTASMVETRTRALITAGAVLAGFEWINSVAAQGDLCRRVCDEAGAVPAPEPGSAPSGQSQ